jgi:redox-sensitive bicupin YhaK (pirin superfamily)
MFEVRKANDRGMANHGWLNTSHTFSFGTYFDPRQQGFSDLLVINDDWVQPGKGFGTHPHNDMEIFTYVLEGALEHKDSIGNGSVIRYGDVQMMSAGTGIQHSEYNPSLTDQVHLLQIWIVPDQKNVTPRYQQVQFEEASKRGQLRLIISPDGQEGSLSVYQDVKVYAGLFDGAESAQINLDKDRFAYFHVAKGELEVNGNRFYAGDGARIRQETVLTFEKGIQAEILLFDLRAIEKPQFD